MTATLKGAVYNEIDEYAAAWLRNLIAKGHIADGEVDTRSIVDVQPDDYRGFVQCHFFAGIGGWSIALRWGGGPTTDLFGQEVAPADPSQTREKWNGSLTNGTFGRIGFGSSRSESLQSSLENRLRARLNGSDLCEVIWKPWITPWGPRRSKPRARVRTTFEIDSGLWPTPKASAAGPDFAKLERSKTGLSLPPLSAGAKISLWSTASARDWKDTPGMAIEGPDGRSRLDQLPRQAQTSFPVGLYPTPTAAIGTGGQKSISGDRKDEVLLTGLIRSMSGSSESMESTGGLNPEFVFWLMGFPPEWINCAP